MDHYRVLRRGTARRPEDFAENFPGQFCCCGRTCLLYYRGDKEVAMFQPIDETTYDFSAVAQIEVCLHG